MIARMWHGVVPAEKADEYVEYLNKTGVIGLQSVDGNQGVYMLRRSAGDNAHFIMLSLWDSVESIKEFAGADYDKARYYPEDADYLLELDEHVLHYDVMRKT